MKIRNGFVSNSSSSSFVCEVCGVDASGWDIGLDEAEMMECSNGHLFCDCHVKKSKDTDKEEIIKMRDFLLSDAVDSQVEVINSWDDDKVYEEAEDSGYFDDSRYDCDPSICPICSFHDFSVDEAFRFLMKKNCLTKKGLLEKMKEEFGDYKNLQEYIKGRQSNED